MKVRDFCSRMVIAAEPATDLRHAARLMREHHVGALVVIDQREGLTRPIGIVTDRDIVIAVVAADVKPESLTVRDVMSEELQLLRDDDDVFEAVEKMSDHGVRRLPVVAADGRLFGMVSADDVLRVLSIELGSLATTLHRGSQREVAARGAALGGSAA